MRTSMKPPNPAPAVTSNPAAPKRVIPRPPAKRPGSPAPWAGLPADQRRGISLDRVRAALAADGTSEPTRGPDGPGPASAPFPDAPGSDGRPAAVLVALFEEDGEARVILTVRSGRLRSHTGEVAFPGGRVEQGESVVEAALREASEEVALDPQQVTVIRALTAMPTISSNTTMTPIVGTLGSRPSLRPSPAEVDRIFDVALSELVADDAFHEEWWSVPGRTAPAGFPDGEFPVWFFDVADETVWGATARTLVELLCVVLGVAVPATLRPR
jgi:8-oxo-dGTP pyrophosphatase MutT (NUDIX family)